MLAETFWLQNKGFSLVEIMISTLLGLFLLTVVLFIYSSGEKQGFNTLKTLSLDNQLRDAMSLMVRDIRRSGYWGSANGSSGNTNNPMMASGAYTLNAAQDCILINYDMNNDGALATINTGSDDERYGYRLKNQAIQTRTVNVSNACSIDTGWVNMTDSNIIQITQLTFTPTVTSIDLDGSSPGTATVAISDLRISISGRLINDTSIQRSLTSEVRIRNDRYTP